MNRLICPQYSLHLALLSSFPQYSLWSPFYSLLSVVRRLFEFEEHLSKKRIKERNSIFFAPSDMPYFHSSTRFSNQVAIFFAPGPRIFHCASGRLIDKEFLGFLELHSSLVSRSLLRTFQSSVRSAKERSRVRSPESAGPKKGPGDLSVGPSIWREVVRRIYP